MLTLIDQGTAAYVAPEVHHGRISVDIDAYALGVVVLEVISGLSVSRPVPTHATIKDFAAEYWDGDIWPLLDPKIKWNEDIACELISFSRRCLDTHPNRRPKMHTAVFVLEELTEGGTRLRHTFNAQHRQVYR